MTEERLTPEAIDPLLIQWRDHLDNVAFPQTNIHEGVFTADVTGMTELHLREFPPQARMVLTGLGSRGSFLVGADDSQPASLRIEAAENLNKLTLRSTWEHRLRDVEIDLRHCGNEVSLVGSIPAGSRLAIVGGASRWDLPTDRGDLSLVDTALRLDQGWGRLDSMSLRGKVIVSGNLSSNATRLGDEPLFLEGGGAVNLGRVESSRPVSITIQGEQTHVSLTTLPEKSAIELKEPSARFTVDFSGLHAHEIKSLRISGSGNVTVGGLLVGPTFDPDPRLELSIPRSGQVHEARGRVFLNVVNSVLTGDRTLPLVLEGIGSLKGAEVESVSLYELQIQDLEPISEAERLAPWIPKPKEARGFEDGMKLGSSTEKLSARRRAHFWTRMSYILSQRHAPGATQSEVRFAAARARRRAIDEWRKEKTLLTLYSIVGYGERVIRPLVAFLVASLVSVLVVGPLGGPKSIVFPIGHAATWERFLLLWRRVLLSPLAFFRVVEPPKVQGFVGELSIALFQLLGIVLLFFTLSSIRRVTKAE